MGSHGSPYSLPPRPRDAHKGVFGHVLVVAGSRGMIGAAALCTQAVLRSGAGLVTTACPESERPTLAGKLSSAMTLGLPETGSGSIARGALEPILEFADRVDVVALGPGLSRNDETQALVRELVPRLPCPLILDADGVVSFSEKSESLVSFRRPAVLTPHPGELSRLIDVPVGEIENDREAVAREVARRTGTILVLKGRETLVTDGDRLARNTTGNPGMATGGSGDVLTGVLAGLLAQGFEPFEAVILGVHVHGHAGDRGAMRLGETSLIAEDLLDELPAAYLALDGPPLPGTSRRKGS